MYLRRDDDDDEISNYDEIFKYHSDPLKSNYVLSYVLMKLPESEALKFKDVENFDENSKGLIDLLASLPREKRNDEVLSLIDKIVSNKKLMNLSEIKNLN